MKKLIAILLVAFLAVSSSYSQAYDLNTLDTRGAGTQTGDAGNTNPLQDLSYDDASGEYKLYVVCELQICNLDPEVNLQQLNPDGSRLLQESEEMDYKVNGAENWKFEAWLGWDKFARYGNDLTNQTPHVYFVGENWTFEDATGGSIGYDAANVTAGNTNLVAPMANIENWKHVTGLNLNPCENCSSTCAGEAHIIFDPHQVVADELAVQGFYYWNTFVAVDYLTWETPVAPTSGGDYPNFTI